MSGRELNDVDFLALSRAAVASSVTAEFLVTHSNLLCKERYSRDASAMCPRCDQSVDPAFSLAPKQRILDVLGYV
jgi:hypothetical protein